jgi:hypothetical protein
MSRRSTAAPNEVWQISANCAEREFDPTTIDEPVFQIRAGTGRLINDLGWRGSAVPAPGQQERQ